MDETGAVQIRPPLDSGEIAACADFMAQSQPCNVFICVSSFNPRARNLYESVGYEVVGELKDYIVAGHSEILLRKTIGPLVGFKPPQV